MKTHQKLLSLPNGFIKQNIPHHIYETYFSTSLKTQALGYMETEGDIDELVYFIDNQEMIAQLALIDHMRWSSHPQCIINFQETEFYKNLKEGYPALMKTLLIWYNG